jgi:sugar lactone lactonase YvrE
MRTRYLLRSILLAILLIVIGALLVIVFLVPSPINSTAWAPPSSPAWTGTLAANNALLKADLLGEGQLEHPEDVAFDNQGRIYAGCEDGNIYRLTLDESGKVTALEVFAKTGGYPVGLHFDKNGNLIAAVKGVGLLSIGPGGKFAVLTSEVNGMPITYANDLDIASDGTIYFSDSSTKFNRGWPYDVLEAKPYGRLLAYDPAAKETRVIKDGLYFANGVLLGPDESFLLVGETTRYRIARYWLKGPQAGTWDYFAENLPIMVDNIDPDGKGGYFVAGSRRLGFIDMLQPNPFIKNQVAKIPFNILKGIPALKSNRFGLILELDQKGLIEQSLQDPTGRVYVTSSANPYKGFLYIGTLYGDAIARYPLNP